MTIHGEQVAAFGDVDAGLGERRDTARIPIFAGINFFDAIHSVTGVGFKIHAEQADVHGMQFRVIAATDIGVRIAQFADHVAQQESEVIAVGHVGQQGFVFFAHAFPIDAVHRFVVKEIALLAPDFVEHLPPFGARIDFGAQVR